MADSSTEIERLQREVAYYRRQLDEVAGDNLRRDYSSSALMHELKQKRQGFAILSQLQRSFLIETPLATIYEMTLYAIHSMLDMDRAIILTCDATTESARPSHWTGYQGMTAGQFDGADSEIPTEVLSNVESLPVNRSTPASPAIEEIRARFDLPFFICVPISVDGIPLCFLLAGRQSEQRPFRPPLDGGDIDTLGAIAGLIASSIQNKRFAALTEERNEIVNLFGQQVSQEIVDELLHNPGETTGTRRLVCVMFLDIRNFTPMCESREPEAVVSYLNTLFNFMIESVNRHDGIINHFLGDGFMATFGAPIRHGEPCRNAVAAAREILDRVRQASDTGVIPPTKIGIGLHVGEAVTGNVGSAIRKQYTITGNVVILASRIEQLNKEFGSQLLVSEAVIEAIGDDEGEAMPLGLVHVKGRHEPISLYRLA